MFVSCIGMGALPSCIGMGGGNPVFFNKVQLYWHYLWEVLKIQPLAVNKSVNQISSEGCSSCKHCKRKLSLSLIHFLTSKLFVSADSSSKLNPPESH